MIAERARFIVRFFLPLWPLAKSEAEAAGENSTTTTATSGEYRQAIPVQYTHGEIGKKADAAGAPHTVRFYLAEKKRIEQKLPSNVKPSICFLHRHRDDDDDSFERNAEMLCR